METGLRLVLMLIGMVILAGIIWDAKRYSSRKNKQTTKTTPCSPGKDGHTIPGPGADYLIPELNDEVEFSDVDVEEWSEAMEVYEPNSVKQEPQLHTAQLDEPSVQDPSQIIILHVMARKNVFFSGKQLLAAFKDASLHFGDLKIFHCYDHATSNPIFSVASAIEPGFLDLSEADHFKTPGVTLFLSLRSVNQPIAAFDRMLRTARQLAMSLDGELRNKEHKLLTTKDLGNYREEARLLSTLLPSRKDLLNEKPSRPVQKSQPLYTTFFSTR